MKDQLISKYQGFIDNLQWHLDVNGEFVSQGEYDVIIARISAYREILFDLYRL